MNQPAPFKITRLSYPDAKKQRQAYLADQLRREEIEALAAS